MVAYEEFVELSNSGDSEARSRAAHFASLAFVDHIGPADEQAALYAALISFLDDDSVKVRAALAYGLLHAECAPRPVMVSLLHDVPIISRAVVQNSPVLVDADLLGIIRSGDIAMLDGIAGRPVLSSRVGEALLAHHKVGVSLDVLKRDDVVLSSEMLAQVAEKLGDNARIRGALFARDELSAYSRMQLVDKVCGVLKKARIVKGAIASHRLDRLMRDVRNSALTSLGEAEASEGCNNYAIDMVTDGQVNARLMLHSIISGNVLFFAQCLGVLGKMPQEKIFTLLNRGGRAALNALFAKCGLGDAVRNLLARLIFHARTVDLADDLAARHFIVTALIDELIIEHEGIIPPDLEDVFSYLNEQNIMLARRAAHGVMSAFVLENDEERALPLPPAEQLLALPAA